MIVSLDLTSYMDESGHSQSPTLHFVGMAGFIAPANTWTAVGKAWQGVLDIFNLIRPFHMKDFSHSKGEYEGWSNPKRDLLIGSLVTIIKESFAKPIGAIVSLEDFRLLSERQQVAFKDPYYLAFQTCTRGAAIKAMAYENEQVDMVYSYNREFGAIPAKEQYSVDQAGNAEQLWHAIKEHTLFGRWMGSYDSGSPKDIVQLQVADLFAWELLKEFEGKLSRPMRWPLKQILGSYMSHGNLPLIRLFDREEMLRTIVEAGWQYTEGTEAIADIDTQMASAHDRTFSRLAERTRGWRDEEEGKDE